MILIVGTIRLPAANMDAARSAMRRMIEATRQEDGCIEYSYAEDVIDAGLVHVKELWRDRPSLEAHFTAPHIGEWRAAWPQFGIADRNLRLYEVGEARPI